MMVHVPALQEQALWAGQHALPLFVTALGVLLTTTGVGWWSMRRRRLSQDQSSAWPAEFMAARTTIGVGVILAGVVVFMALAGQFGGAATIREADRIFTDALRTGISRPTMQVFAGLTRMADTSTLTVLGIAVAILLVILRRPWLGLAWVIAVAGNAVINPALKQVFARIRPLRPEGFVFERSFSFPSGHSSGCVVAYGMLAYLALRILPTRWQLPSLLLAVTAIVTIGASRLFLQVHFASDVLAGFASGSAWLATCITSIELIRRYRFPTS